MKNRKKTGFTLIELLVVVLIVGILSSVALPQYSVAVEKARSAEALTLMNAVAGASERYCFQKDVWPTSVSQLDIEIPFSSTTPGGKNFAITLGPGTGSSCTGSTPFSINAVRNLANGKGKYTLKTVLTNNSTTETITAVRSCSFGTDAKGETFCKAITNNHNDNF